MALSVGGAAARMGASAEVAEYLERALKLAGITDPREHAHFLGQCAVETGGFKRYVESLNYSVDALLRTFGRHRITDAECRRFGRRPGKPADQQAIGNCVYGGPWGANNLGNLDEGDGWKFRGRGAIQTTGRHNYTALSMGMFGDARLIANPDLLGTLPLAVDSAIFYWQSRRIGMHALRGDIKRVTLLVNGGRNHLAERTERTRFAHILLK